MKNQLKELPNKLEGVWEKHSIIISILIGLSVSGLYYINFIVNIRQAVGNVITFSSIVIGVNGVFLTLIITLQESPAFKRLRDIMPTFEERLYISLRTQIQYGLILVTLSIVINLMPPSPHKLLSTFGVSVWFTFFSLMTIGSFVSVKLVTDIIVKNFNIPKKQRRE